MSDPAAQGGDERELRRLNRALRMLSDSNQALIRITDEAQLLREICRIAVEVGGYRMAWVGFPENDERKTVRVAAVNGANEGYLESMGIVWADVPRGRGPAGTAIRTGQVRIIHDILNDPSTEPWREAARQRGYEAIAALPLLSGGRVLGALSVNAPAAGAFDDEEIKILAELAGDLAFGLAALRTRAEHERAQELLHKSDEVFRAIVENSPDLIMRFDRELLVTYVNPALCRTFGRPAESFLYQPLGAAARQARAQENPEGVTRVRQVITGIFNDGVPAELEVCWPTPGGEKIFNGRYFPERDRSGTVVSVLTIARDITERRRAEEALQSVLRHARTTVMQSTVTAPEGWDGHEPEWSAPHYRWESHFEDEAAAQDVMPIELAPGEKYYAGWVRAKHPDDGAPMALVAARAFVSGAPSWQQEFRAIDRYGQEHWFAQVASVRATGAGRWQVTTINTDITERRRVEGALQNVLLHARSMVMDGVAIAPDGWDQNPPEWSVARYQWTAQFMNVAAAQEVMPLALAPGESYHAAWVRARHPDDLGATDLTAARAFVSGASSWRQEFRAIDRHGRLHWFAQVASIRSSGAGRWQVTTINTDVTELRQAERERQEHLWLFENLDRVNRAIQQADTIEEMMTTVLDALLEVFGCDRAWLVFPCDPTAASWQVPMERTRPEYPGALALGVEVPMDPTAAEVMRLVLAQDGAVKFGAGEPHPVPPAIAEAFHVRSFIAMALHPRGARPYVFGLHQCSHARVWTLAEGKLLEEIGHRLAGALTNLLADRALQESRLRLEMANRASKIGPWDWDLVTNEVQFSAEWKRQLGYEPHEIAGRYQEWESRLHPDDRDRALAAVRAYLAGESSNYELEFRLRHKDGSYRWIFTRGEILRSLEGKPLRLIGCHVDVTERKQAEEALRRSQQDYVSLVNTVDGIVWELDVPTFRFTFVSEQAERLLGYPTARWIDEPGFWQEHLHPDDRGWAIDYCVKATNEKRDHSFRYRMLAADGRSVWLHDIVTVVVENDRPAKLRGIMVDITESKAADEALRWRTALFEAQVDSSIDGILVVDSQGTKILQNERMNELWKIPREVVENPDDTVQLRYVTGRTKHPAAFAEKVAHLYGHPEEVSRDEIELIDGTFLDRYSAPVRDKSGKHYGRIWAFRDVTATRQLEEQLRQSQKMEAVGQLAGGIAHDFNNLLTVIQLQTSMILLEESLRPAIEQSVQQIKEAATRAANLTRQLLTFSRQNVKQARALDIGEVVTSTTKLLRRVLGEDVSLESRFASGLPLIHADPGMMEQVLMNLVINARDAMPGGGRLTLALDVVDLDANYVAQHSAARTGRFVSLTVTDSGTGIPPENLPRIFEPFFTTKDVGKGTGLGLATVYGILQLHQGWIEVQSELGSGSEFRVFLPALDEAAAGEVLQLAPEVRGGTESVLLVEDEAVVRAVATAALERRGYHVISAATAADALRTWEEHHGKFDLLLTDLVMPGGISGQTLAEQLGAIRPGLKVIFTSGYSDEVVTRQLRLTPGENFLPKPYPLEDLLRIVRQRLDGA